MIQVPTVILKVNHRDVTADFSPWLIDVSFTDHVAGESDGLEVRLSNAEGLWTGAWYPVKGSTIEAWLGYEGQPLLACGEFQVDEIEIEGPPDTVSIKALGTGNQTALRTPKSKAYEGKSLRAIAQEVAASHGLELVGEVPEITWRRVTQHRETDLTFLARLGKEHGLVFSVKGNSLIFHDILSIEGQPGILQLRPSDLSSYRFREKMTVGGAAASYFDGDTKELRVVEVQLDESKHPDRKKIRRRTEGKGQSQRLAHMAVRTAKGWERDGSLTLPGEPRLVAGANAELEGLGVLNGLWTILSARHKVSRDSGYTTELEVRHVAR